MDWGMEHKDGQGNLIARQVGIQAPEITCISLKCLIRYLALSLTYTLTMLYHRRRIKYAEKHRRDKILDRYRTGEPSPSTLWGAIAAHIKLTCPVCRRYEVGYPN